MEGKAKKRKTRRKRLYWVDVQFNSFDLVVQATTEAEAKRIAFERVLRKSIRGLMDKGNTRANLLPE